jgi:hypothetical protein
MQCLVPVFVLAFVLMAAAPSAVAQDTNDEREARAQALFERGRELYEQHQLSAAIEAFLESDRLAPTANNAFNIAQTYELIGRLEDAFNWYQRYLAHDVAAASAASVAERASALLDRLAVLDVTVVPSEAALSVDGAALAAGTGGKRSIAVPAGAHTLEARGPAHQPLTIALEAVTGKRVEVMLELLPAEGRLSVDSTPSGAFVLHPPQVEPLGRTPLRMAMAPQELHLVLRLDGYRDQDATVRVEPERTAQLALTLQARPAAVASVPASASAPASGRSAGLGVYRWVGYGAAAALFATGLGVGALAIDKKNEVERDPLRRERDEVDQLNLAADLTCGAGVLTGLVTLLLDVGVLGIGPVHAD